MDRVAIMSLGFPSKNEFPLFHQASLRETTALTEMYISSIDKMYDPAFELRYCTASGYEI